MGGHKEVAHSRIILESSFSALSVLSDGSSTEHLFDMEIWIFCLVSGSLKYAQFILAGVCIILNFARCNRSCTLAHTIRSPHGPHIFKWWAKPSVDQDIIQYCWVFAWWISPCELVFLACCKWLFPIIKLFAAAKDMRISSLSFISPWPNFPIISSHPDLSAAIWALKSPVRMARSVCGIASSTCSS